MTYLLPTPLCYQVPLDLWLLYCDISYIQIFGVKVVKR